MSEWFFLCHLKIELSHKLKDCNYSVNTTSYYHHHFLWNNFMTESIICWSIKYPNTFWKYNVQTAACFEEMFDNCWQFTLGVVLRTNWVVWDFKSFLINHITNCKMNKKPRNDTISNARMTSNWLGPIKFERSLYFLVFKKERINTTVITLCVMGRGGGGGLWVFYL